MPWTRGRPGLHLRWELGGVPDSPVEEVMSRHSPRKMGAWGREGGEELHSRQRERDKPIPEAWEPEAFPGCWAGSPVESELGRRLGGGGGGGWGGGGGTEDGLGNRVRSGRSLCVLPSGGTWILEHWWRTVSYVPQHTHKTDIMGNGGKKRNRKHSLMCSVFIIPSKKEITMVTDSSYPCEHGIKCREVKSLHCTSETKVSNIVSQWYILKISKKKNIAWY